MSLSIKQTISELSDCDKPLRSSTLADLSSLDPAEVRCKAIEALGKIGGVKTKECLKKCLDSSDEVTQQAAEEALHQLEVEEDPLSFKIEPGEHWRHN